MSKEWRLIRETYRTTVKACRSDTAAFERAVKALLDQSPTLGSEEARREVARMLVLEPTDGEETGT